GGAGRRGRDAGVHGVGDAADERQSLPPLDRAGRYPSEHRDEFSGPGSVPQALPGRADRGRGPGIPGARAGYAAAPRGRRPGGTPSALPRRRHRPARSGAARCQRRAARAAPSRTRAAAGGAGAGSCDSPARLLSSPRPHAHVPRLFLGCILLSAAACRATPSAAPGELVDDTGARTALAAPPRRIVSLIPATTELLFALGAGDRVVGRTHYCD